MIQNQILYRVTKNSFGEEKKQFVLPEKYWSQVLHSLNDDSGHLGVERTTEGSILLTQNVCLHQAIY